MRRDPAKLVFEDGVVHEGLAFGARGEAFGEVVFNTAMTGYQEILTDPSYRGQIVLMTYPHIGNTGVNERDAESRAVHTRALVVREFSAVASNWRARDTLERYLREHDVVGIEGVDTREIVLHIRSKGALRAVVSTEDLDEESLLRKVRRSPSIEGRDCVREVTRWAIEEWTEPLDETFFPSFADLASRPRRHVVAYDFGIKHNILRALVSCGFRVTVVPGHTKAEDVLALRPEGIFLSNGPGDPEPVSYAVETIRAFLDQGVPTFGICLGHQLTALALGARTYKMKFGHHGANHPVLDKTTGRIEITSQNHSFAVDADTVDPSRATITHIDLNDETVEGLEVAGSPCFTVQYHPEAAPGPHDSLYLFRRFRALVDEHAARAGSPVSGDSSAGRSTS